MTMSIAMGIWGILVMCVGAFLVDDNIDKAAVLVISNIWLVGSILAGRQDEG